jgi:hypothetical protein
LYRGINDSTKGYQSRTNTVEDEKGDMVTDSHNSLARWRNHFSQLLNVHGINDVMQTELQQSLVPEPSVFEVEMAVKQLKAHKSPGADQIPV